MPAAGTAVRRSSTKPGCSRPSPPVEGPPCWFGRIGGSTSQSHHLCLSNATPVNDFQAERTRRKRSQTGGNSTQLNDLACEPGHRTGRTGSVATSRTYVSRCKFSRRFSMCKLDDGTSTHTRRLPLLLLSGGSPDRVSRSGDAPILEQRLVPRAHTIRGNDGTGPTIWTLHVRNHDSEVRFSILWVNYSR